MEQAYIQGFSRCIPEKRITNNDLSAFLDTSDEWIYTHTGVRARHVASDGEAASDLAIKAGRKAIQNAQLAIKDIDLIIVSTSTPDYPGSIPSTACIVQHGLGATHSGAFDVGNACSGFVYGLEIARNFICSGSAQNILFVCSEIYSTVVDWTDRKTCVLFGDGAAAVIVSKNTAPERCSGMVSAAILGSDGKHAENLLRKAGGSKFPLRSENYTAQDSYLFMNGRQVFNFALRVIPHTITQILEREQLDLDEITAIVPHQANQRLIEAASKNCKIPIELFFSNIAEYANTASASIPIALVDMAEQNLLTPGSNILSLSFGAGFSYGANIIRF